MKAYLKTLLISAGLQIVGLITFLILYEVVPHGGGRFPGFCFFIFTLLLSFAMGILIPYLYELPAPHFVAAIFLMPTNYVLPLCIFVLTRYFEQAVHFLAS